jgi:hypothetical protein
MPMSVETRGPIGSPQTRAFTAASANMMRGMVAIFGADEFHAALAGAANPVGIGIVEEDSPTLSVGDDVSVVMDGETPAIIGAAVAPGQFLKADATNRLIPAVAAGDNVIAFSLSQNENPGDWVTVRVLHFIHP